MNIPVGAGQTGYKHRKPKREDGGTMRLSNAWSVLHTFAHMASHDAKE